MQRRLLFNQDQLTDVLIFSDGSLAFAGNGIYLMIRNSKGKETMRMIKAGGRTHDDLVPVSEHVSKTIAINSLYGVLSVIHYHLGKTI